MRDIFVSPHPDDIAYSAFIAAAQPDSRRRTLITVFTRSAWNFAGIPFREVDRITALRAAEERAFAESWSLDLSMLGLPDGRLRGYDDITEYVTPTNADPMYARVREELTRILVSAGTLESTVYAPLGISSHVDHLMCRDIVLEAVPLGRVRLYEDLPYVAAFSEEQIRAFAGAIDSRFEPVLMTAPKFLDQKRGAIASYASQLEPHTASRILGYAERIGGGNGPCERYWHARTASA
jgi:LmbE family N-acetylglucosaminyl deacetylase